MTEAGLALVNRSTVAADGKATEEKVKGSAVLAEDKAAITTANGVDAGAKVVIVAKS